VSPGPVREALRALAAEGLVVPLSQRGYRVTAVSIEDLHDTYRLRRTLDPLAVSLAVPRLTRERLDEMSDAFEKLSIAFKNNDWTNLSLHHRRFHFGIYDACGSPWLIRILAMLWDNSARYQRLSAYARGSHTQRSEEHRQILAACRDGDADRAAALMREHLARTERAVERVSTMEMDPQIMTNEARNGDSLALQDALLTALAHGAMVKPTG
jgi:DNA-binding GntR family transcriptional regulator